MAQFETLKAAIADLVFSPRNATLLLAKYEEEPVLTVESPTDGSLDIPEYYESVGHFEKQAGVAVGMDLTSTEVEAYGEIDPIRILQTGRETSLEISLYEHKKLVQELVWSQDLSDITPTEWGGVVVEATPTPETIFYHAILLGKDRINGEDLYPFWLMPKVQLSGLGNVELNDEGALMYRPTLRALKDDGTGYSVAQGWCGPGWRRRLDKTGFAPTVTSITGTPAASSIEEEATTQISVVDSNGINRTPDVHYAVTTGPELASVSSTGLVTAIGAGAVVVTVTLKRPGTDVTDTVEITVTEP